MWVAALDKLNVGDRRKPKPVSLERAGHRLDGGALHVAAIRAGMRGQSRNRKGEDQQDGYRVHAFQEISCKSVHPRGPNCVAQRSTPF